LIPKYKNIESFIFSNIFNFIPKSFLENFKYNLKMSQSNLFPKNPSFIFTSSLNFFDEIFKVYAAFQLKNKKPIFIGQHGNNYFSRIHNNYLPELNYATKFLSWGYESAKFKNVIGLFNFKTLKQNIKRKNSSRNKIVIFFDFLNNVSDNLFYNPQEITASLSRIDKFLINLKKEIKDNAVLRLNYTFYKKIYGQIYSDYYKNFKIEIDDGKKDVSKILDQAKLCIFNYDSTGFLENICNNVPSIMLLDEDYLNFISDDFKKKYENLISSKLIFFKNYQLANHVNEIWDEVDIWWESKAVQNSLKLFNSRFNEKGNCKSLQLMSTIIKKNI
jgi:putative transferase (TIGR04331 family)